MAMECKRVLRPCSSLFILFCSLPCVVSQDNATSPSSPVDSSASSGPSESLYRAHGWLLWIAFGLLYPVGILITKYGQEVLKPWFHLHWLVQVVATFCATAGIAIGLKEFDALVDSTHAKLGLSLGVLVWLQALLGVVARPRKGGRSRQMWYFSHWLFGTGGVILGWFNIFKGLDLYVQDWPDDGSLKGLYIAFSVQVAVVGFVYLFLDRRMHLLSQSKAPQLKHVQLENHSKINQEEFQDMGVV